MFPESGVAPGRRHGIVPGRTVRPLGIAAALAAATAWVGPIAAGSQIAAPTPCPGESSLYVAENAARIWVIRQGTVLMSENPLRPLTRDRAVVLEVVVNGRKATAHGFDEMNLHQSGTPADLEKLGGEPIRWAGEEVSLPNRIRVVADDGTTLMGPLAFVSCAALPSAKPVSAARPAKPPANGRSPDRKGTAAASREPPGMPQGALPSLELPVPR